MPLEAYEKLVTVLREEIESRTYWTSRTIEKQHQMALLAWEEQREIKIRLLKAVMEKMR